MRRLREREAGFTMVELIGALGIMSIGFVTLTGAFAASTRSLVQSRQRQVATDQANGALEFIRNIPYDQVGLQSAPAYSADPTNPDHYVNSIGTEFDHDHNGTFEPLLNSGSVPHIEGPTARGATTITTYQYVTWVDDPVGGATTEDYKRVTVVVLFSATSNPGRSNTVQISALLTADSVTIGGTSTAPQTGSSSSPVPTPTVTPGAGCVAGDTTAPTGTITILSGTGAQTGYTNSTIAQIKLSPSDPCTPISVRLSNDDGDYGAWFTYDETSPTISWTLESGDGVKTVWAQFSDAYGNRRTIGPETITLDATAPSAPGALTVASCYISGNDRSVSFTWGEATDTNYLGFRIYKQINAAGWTVLATSSFLSADDTDLKTYNSLQYKVVAYDKAGNEGPSSNVVTLSKNVCA
jgi:hypothetical protein